MKKLFLKLLLAVGAFLVLILAYMGWFFHQMGVVQPGVPIVRVTGDRSALLVINIQQGTTGKFASFFAQGLVRQSGPFIQNVNQVIEKAQARKIPVIYIRHENTNKVVQTLMPSYLPANSTISALDPRVRVVPGEMFVKYKMDTFSNSDFDRYLRTAKINHLIVTGLDASQCVDRTIRGALQRGYTVTALSDAIISTTEKKRDEMFRAYVREGATLIPMAQW